ncbi:PTS IIA-like nitrogen-regulatory protein modulated sodium/hydrogen exchanger [Desulfosarcina variabilis str. Montpellier]|uniref:cation:proton antiporter domain-containing protein n=1 Tax=Desulfosarcina variabilis TaxID=2300 RepID=UPI003AFB434F
MSRLNAHEVWVLLLGLGILIGFARTLGEVARRFNLPSVAGEILAGILLGPTVLGSLAPHWLTVLFPGQGPNAIVLHGFTTVAVALFLLVAGVEVDLSTIWKQGRTAITVGLVGMLVPFCMGFALAWWLPQWAGHAPGTPVVIHALFIATVLSVSALPVIAKILMEMNLYRTDLGMVIIAGAVLGDLAGWILFAVILGMMGATATHTLPVAAIILLTLSFAAGMLTLGRMLIHRMLVWVQAHTTWPGGVLAFALTLGLLGAALTEWIGVHAIFGSFLVGVAIGDSPQLKEQTRMVLDQFVSFFFAPLFFASIGLYFNFKSSFDLSLILTLLTVTVTGKVVGCSLGAWLSNMSRRESLAVSAGMITQGSMGIILGLLALRMGVIDERLFIALVVVSVVTAMISGPFMQRILKREKSVRLVDVLTAKNFVHRMKAVNREEAIAELSQAVARTSGLSAGPIEQAVLQREEIMSTGLGKGVAIPHARLEKLSGYLVGLGISVEGIDFDAPDGKPARIILMILGPLGKESVQLDLIADAARLFRNDEIRAKALRSAGYTEFRALIKPER